MNIAKTLTRNSYVLFQNEKICQMLNSASQQFSNLGNFSSDGDLTGFQGKLN